MQSNINNTENKSMNNLYNKIFNKNNFNTNEINE